MGLKNSYLIARFALYPNALLADCYTIENWRKKLGLEKHALYRDYRYWRMSYCGVPLYIDRRNGRPVGSSVRTWSICLAPGGEWLFVLDQFAFRPAASDCSMFIWDVSLSISRGQKNSFSVLFCVKIFVYWVSSVSVFLHLSLLPVVSLIGW